MSRRSLFIATSTLFLLALGVSAALVGLIRYEPAGYAHPPVPAEPEALRQRSHEFKEKITALISATTNGDPQWDEEFTDEQINSYFEEDFVESGLDQRILPECISRPRVTFEEDRVRLAFRYGSGIWSSVITIDLRVWLPKCEPNVVAMELEGFHAGALPISTQSLLERVSEVGRQSGMDLSWYRHNGHPVALLRFGTDQPRPTVFLETLQLRPGSLAVKGRATDSVPVRAMLPAPDATLASGK